MPRLYEPQQSELSNGIPVIFQHYEGPVAATYWWNDTGSTNEEPEESGFAHFLEHMLFKDAAAKESGKASTGETARLIESLGGDINAYTSFDHTVYHVTCASHHWENVIDRFGIMAKPQRFLKKDFEREREVILEELRKNEDSPGRQLFQSLFSKTYGKHPYGRPVIGFEHSLRSATVGQLEKFYKKHYVSAKMGLILVGPLGANFQERKKKLLQILEKRFGAKVIPAAAFKGTQNRQSVRFVRDRSEWEVKRFDVKSPSLSLSFRVPELGHPDLPALDLLTGVLGMGELSRLYQRLFYQTSLTTDIAAGLYVPKDPGMLYISAEFDSLDKMKPGVEEILTELKRMREVGPTSEEISRVLINAESERLYATQTADGMAGRVGFLKFVVGDLEFDQEYLRQLRETRLEDVRRVASQYLDYRRLSGVFLIPKEAPELAIEDYRKLVEEGLTPDPAFVEKQKPSKSAARGIKVQSTPDLVSYTLSSGMVVRFKPRPHSHVFSIHSCTLGGLRLELASPIKDAQSDWGASYLLASTWPKGTTRLDARAISAQVEGRAASLDGFSGRNSIGLQMTGLSRDWEDLSSLFTEVLLDPGFPSDEVEHARRLAEDSIKTVEDHSSQLCSKLFLETLFEKHPYGKMAHGSLESLRDLDSERLKAFHRLWVRPERLVISVSGSIHETALRSWVEKLDQHAQQIASGESSIKLPVELADEAALRAPRWVERSLGREQVHIIMGGLGTRINAEDRFALRVLHTLLGGQSGRLFIELREKKSLAYSVTPVSFEGIERGYAGVYIACAPEKRKEAELGVTDVLEKLVKKGPSEKEMDRAKEFFLGRRAMDLQSDASLASHFGLEALYGISHMTEEELIKKIRKLTRTDIQKVCKKYMLEPYQVTSAVG